MKIQYPFSNPKNISQRFGEINNTLYKTWGGKHPGLDIAAPLGEAILGTEGNVRFAGSDGNWGFRVNIRVNDDVDVWYCHLSWINVKQGQHISNGDVIGWTGSTGTSTGPHLHLGIKDQSKPGLGNEHWQNPELYI